jgi:hypothetical protein
VEALARLVLFVTCLLAIYVGARTLLIWRRTRKVAESAERAERVETEPQA